MEELKAVLDFGNRTALFVIDGEVVQHQLDPNFVHLPSGAKDSTDSENFTSARSAVAFSGFSRSEEKRDTEEDDPDRKQFIPTTNQNLSIDNNKKRFGPKSRFCRNEKGDSHQVAASSQ